jgi:hypothetical protein
MRYRRERFPFTHPWFDTKYSLPARRWASKRENSNLSFRLPGKSYCIDALDVVTFTFLGTPSIVVVTILVALI